MPLNTYRRKRDFSRTSEPAGKPSRAGKKRAKSKGLCFVIQKHAASRLHYDFRLEMEGVLRSWAVPKGPSLDPGEKRLAVQVEDHPIEYGDFEGIIPPGEYGGGTVVVWDRGTWTPEGDPIEAWRSGKLKFQLHGEKLRGGWTLVRMHGERAGENKENWLLIKELRDEEARPGSGDAILTERPESVLSGQKIEEIAADPPRVWESNRPEKARRGAKRFAAFAATAGKAARRPASRPKKAGARARGGAADRADRIDAAALPAARKAALPRQLEPQLATLVAEPPEGDEWLHEIKYDGYRALCEVRGGKARLLTRHGKDWTAHFPGIAQAVSSLPVESALLDGEVVVIEADGRTSFQALQNALSEGRDGDLVCFAFDLLYLDGYDLRRAPLTARKAALAALLDGAAGPIRFSDHVQGQGKGFFRQACQHALEGTVAKRAEQPYHSGRSRDWLKVKCLQRQEFVIGGFTDPEGARSGLGALLVGVYDDGELVFSGKVGTGFSQRMLVDLRRRLDELERATPAFVNPPRGAAARGAHWVEPELVAEIAFSEWTRDGILRHPSFQGLREDKEPREIRREKPADLEAVADGKETASGRGPGKTRTRKSTGRSAGKGGTALAKNPAGGDARRTYGGGKARAAGTRKKLVRAPGAGASPSPPDTAGQGPGGIGKPGRGPRGVAGGDPIDALSRPGSLVPRGHPPTEPTGKHPGPAKAERRGSAPVEISGARLTHPDKVLYPDRGFTKLDLALYYKRVAGWILPHLSDRPLTLVRCPEGQAGECFYQKHVTSQFPSSIRRVDVEEDGKTVPYGAVDSLPGLIGLVQMGVLELHVWGAHRDQIERPDYLVLDLDPDEGLEWERIVEGALLLRDLLAATGLRSFLKTTGGKGLHVVLPLARRHSWDEAKAFTKAVADGLVAAEPDRYTSNMSKARRKGKIFVDYLRNGRGATSIAPYSTRARPGAPVSTPLDWAELDTPVRANTFTIETLPRRLEALAADPWADFAKVKQSITTAMKKQWGMEP
jgi:bifunctional non-homologous end joining protein LigD